MKVGDLIAALGQYDEDDDVNVVVSVSSGETTEVEDGDILEVSSVGFKADALEPFVSISALVDES